FASAVSMIVAEFVVLLLWQRRLGGTFGSVLFNESVIAKFLLMPVFATGLTAFSLAFWGKELFRWLHRR
ncbi:MAG: hypothetical protein DMG64_20180, partial [Acidobacteria bacterium]